MILGLGAGRRAARAMTKYLKTKEWPVVLDDETAPTAVLPAAEANVCSKCQRPFEPGDDEHICCAGERLEWSCSSCQKVSEGFAFPCGLCPLCGGMLVRGHHTPVADAAALLRLAVHLEKRARAFFLDAGMQFETGSAEWKLSLRARDRGAGVRRAALDGARADGGGEGRGYVGHRR